MSALIENLAARLRERRDAQALDAETRFAQLVESVHRGDDLDPDETLETLDELGLDVGELEAAVQLLDQRIRDAALLGERDGLEDELRTLDAKAAADKRRFEAVCVEIYASEQTTQERRSAVEGRLAAIEQAAIRLRQSCASGRLLSVEQRLVAKNNAIAAAVREKAAAVKDLERKRVMTINAHGKASESRHHTPSWKLKELAAAIKVAESNVAAGRKALAAATKAKAEVDAELLAVTDAKLAP